MGETGKRYRHHRDDLDNKNQKRRTDRGRDRDENGIDELIVYRILCPDGVIGSVIGKSGKVINSIRQDSRAKVKVVDPFPGSKDRVILTYCYVRDKEDVEVDEEFNNNKPLSPAQDALLKVHAAIANAVATVGESDGKNKDKSKEGCQLLVPASQSSNIIGKSGATIKKLRNKTRTNIKVIAKDISDPSHSCALEFDNFVQISGDSEAVKKALFAISVIMHKFAPKETIPLDTSIPEAPPSIIIPADVPIYPATGHYPNVDSIAPTRSISSILGHTNTLDIPGYTDAGTSWPVYQSTTPVVSGYGGSSQAEELIVKVVCPGNVIGRVIGKGGSSIRNIRQDSGARVDVEDPKPKHNECVITVISMEALDDLKSSAVEAVLLLQAKINDEDVLALDDLKSSAVEAVLLLQAKINDEEDETITMRLLIPSKVIGCIIGKSGSIINEIRKRTKADIRISKGEKPKCADDNDELVEIFGQVGSVRDALVQIVLRLRDDVLKDREGGQNSFIGGEALYSGGASLPVQSGLPSVSSTASFGYEKRPESGSGLGLLSSSAYGYKSLSMGDSSHGQLPSRSSSLYSRFPPPSTLDMVIPAHAIGKVIGKGGTNIENIRQISGANIEISDPKSSNGDRVALISGTPEQKRAAENLIQAFILAT